MTVVVRIAQNSDGHMGNVSGETEKLLTSPVDGFDQCDGLGGVVAERLVELDGLPPDGQSAKPSFVVPLQTLIATVPPTMARLDAEPDVGPGKVDVDFLTGLQVQRVLSDGFSEAGCPDRFDHVKFKATLGGTLLVECESQPTLDTKRAVFSHPPMVTQVRGCGLRCHQTVMPAVLGGALKPSVVEPGSEVVQHPMRFGHDGSSGESAAIAPRLVPICPPNVDPVWQGGIVSFGNRDSDLAVVHVAKTVQPPGGDAGEESSVSEVQRDGGAASEKRVRRRAEANCSAGHVDDEVGATSSRELGNRHIERPELRAADHAELACRE